MKSPSILTSLSLSFMALAPLTAQDAQPAEAQQEAAAPALSAEEMIKRISLGLGYQSGMQAASANLQGEDLSSDEFLKGFNLALQGDELPYSDEEIRAGFAQLQEILTTREEQIAQNNQEAGEKFLAENKGKDGVVTTESGLQYQIQKEGNGEKADLSKDENKLYLVHYKGTLPDGTEFDSSDGENPVPFPLQGVIPGFSEALKLMDKGAKWRLFIPSDLAYGEQRRSRLIGPNQVLVFDLEVADIQDAPAPQNQGFTIPGMPQQPGQ